MIQKNMGMTVGEIVRDKGWDDFREKEKQVVKFLSKKGDCVIATGGGFVIDDENVDLLRRTSLLIWLNSPLQDIVERLKNDPKSVTLRPPLTGNNLEQEIADTLQARIPLYQRAADHTVNTAGKSAVQIADEIYQCLLKPGFFDKIK